MSFVQYPDRLLTLAATLRDHVDTGLRGCGDRLLAAARTENAYGLAAAHIGEIEPVIVVSPDGRDHRLLFNPQIVATAEATEGGEEGSVSLPGARVVIRRPAWAEVAYMDADGSSRKERFDGFLARVVQHEIEQMHGVFFLEHLSRLKRDMLMKKLRKVAG